MNCKDCTTVEARKRAKSRAKEEWRDAAKANAKAQWSDEKANAVKMNRKTLGCE